MSYPSNSWQERALCAGAPDAWDLDQSDLSAWVAAIEACAQCSVQAECAVDASRYYQSHVIRAGSAYVDGSALSKEELDAYWPFHRGRRQRGVPAA